MAEPMSDVRLAEIRKREQAALKGPWRWEDNHRDLNRWATNEDGTLEIGFGYIGNRTQEVAEFVTQARADIPDLLAEVERLWTLTGTCTCVTLGVAYKGPQADCSVHGAIRGFAEATAENERLREALDFIATDLEKASAEDKARTDLRDTFAHGRARGYAEAARTIRALLDGGQT